MKSKKSILIIGPFPNPITGLSLANEVLLKGLKKSNVDVDYIDMSYLKFEEKVGAFSFFKMFFFIKLNFKALKIYKYDSIYITIGQSFFGVIKYSFFLLIATLFGKKKVVHLHGNQLGEMYTNQNKIKKTIIKSIMKLADYGIVLSESLRDNLSPFIENKNIYVVNNFVEKEFQLTEGEKKLKNYTNLRIIYIGNLMTEKGVFVLLDALNKLRAKGILFHAKFAGNIDSAIREKFMNYIKKNSCFEYLGVLRGTKKKQLLMWGNIFVFPSYLIEGLPLSILEAMNMGNSIISTKHPALIDNFNKENIDFIKKKSVSDIVDSLVLINSKFETKKINNNLKLMVDFKEEEFVNSIKKILIQ